MRNMKPILFNTEMVQAILEGRKTVTRRYIKKWQGANDCMGVWRNIDEDGKVYIKDYKYDLCWMEEKYYIKRYAKYQVGDILYVKETWNQLAKVDKDGYTHYDDLFYVYKADKEQCDLYNDDGMYLDDTHRKWKPSIHTPKEAARIFLRVTNVRVEKLQDIHYYEVYKEGIKSSDICNAKCKKKETCVSEQTLGKCHVINTFKNVWDDCYAYPKPVKVNGVLDHYESYHWEDIQETREYKELPWLVCGNPYVFVYDFEVISKEEAMKEVKK